jgi:hypothetical protein
MSDLLEYDKTIVDSIHHVEDILVKFALQNYAAAGAVILAYYTAKINIKIAAPAVIVLGLVFTWAIWSNVQRYALLWKMHGVVRDRWLTSQSELREAFRGEPDCETYLNTRKLPGRTFIPLYVINLLPAALAAVALGWWAHTGDWARAVTH